MRNSARIFAQSFLHLPGVVTAVDVQPFSKLSKADLSGRIMVCHNPGSAAALPEALTAQILQHVPQQQRLQQCALVCKAWASAAALATAHVELKRTRGQTISAFNSWLQQHAGQLESLQLSYVQGVEDEQLGLQLPSGKLAKLQRLELEGFKILLPGECDSSSSTEEDAPTSAAPLLLNSLQHLQLYSVQFISISSLLKLAGVPGLTSLKTKDISFAKPKPVKFCSWAFWGNDKPAMQQLAADLPSLLQQLPRLAVLELPGMPMSAAAMQQLGGMQGLHELVLTRAEHMPPCKPQHLPSSITQLQFAGDIYIIGPESGNDPSLPPQLPQLAGLLKLQLQECTFTPTVLGAFTRLQELKLRDCTLLPLGADGSEFDTEGTAALLDALAQTTCLQDLELALDGLDTVSTAPQRFAALTASTHLTRLVLEPDDCIPLAKGAVQYMFPTGRQLPLLQHITIRPHIEDAQGWDLTEWCIDSADISRIASCCSGLGWLDIARTVKPGADLSVLLELPRSCINLLVGSAAFEDAAASVLVQLTHLEYLCLDASPRFTDVGLEQLSQLDLGDLNFYHCGLSDAISDKGTLELQWGSEKGPVWQQLEALCDLSPLCAPARLRRQKEANKHLRSVNTQLCSDNKQLQSENAALRLQLQRSQANVQGQ